MIFATVYNSIAYIFCKIYLFTYADFKANMEQMAKAIDEKDRYDDDLLETIKLILMAIRKDKR